MIMKVKRLALAAGKFLQNLNPFSKSDDSSYAPITGVAIQGVRSLPGFYEYTSGHDEYRSIDFPSSIPPIIVRIVATSASALIFAIMVEVLFFTADVGWSWYQNEGATPQFISDLKWQSFVGVISLGYAIGDWVRRSSDKREYTLVDGTVVRFVWTGSGQAQFGVGEQGLSIATRFTHYGVQWEKVTDVYDEEDPFSSHYQKDIVVRHVRYGRTRDDENSAYDPSLWRETLNREKELVSDRKIRPNIRIRLRNGAREVTELEEIIIPKRFFGPGESMSWQSFVEHCKGYMIAKNISKQ